MAATRGVSQSLAKTEALIVVAKRRLHIRDANRRLTEPQDSLNSHSLSSPSYRQTKLTHTLPSSSMRAVTVSPAATAIASVMPPLITRLPAGSSSPRAAK